MDTKEMTTLLERFQKEFEYDDFAGDLGGFVLYVKENGTQQYSREKISDYLKEAYSLGLEKGKSEKTISQHDRSIIYDFFRKWLAEADADTGKDFTYPILADFTKTFGIPWKWFEEKKV